MYLPVLHCNVWLLWYTSSTHTYIPIVYKVAICVSNLLYIVIYVGVDAIDNGQNKKVLQLVDKLLKKTPSLHCAKVWGWSGGRGKLERERERVNLLYIPGAQGNSSNASWSCR